MLRIWRRVISNKGLDTPKNLVGFLGKTRWKTQQKPTANLIQFQFVMPVVIKDFFMFTASNDQQVMTLDTLKYWCSWWAKSDKIKNPKNTIKPKKHTGFFWTLFLISLVLRHLSGQCTQSITHHSSAPAVRV